MLCCILLLGGCAVGPDYKRPDTVALDGYKEDVPTKIQEEGGVKWRPASPGVPDASAWWTSFNDPLLNEMMEALGQENQRIQSALANLRMAHAQVREARASFFPALNTNMSRARGNDQHGFAETTYNAQLQANWELDLWGATRRGVESQTAVAREEAANLGAVILSMRAELATNYFQLRTYDELIEYYDETIRAFTRSWQITKDQQEAGIATPADVARSLAQLRAAEAQAVNIALQRKKMEHAIAVLLGKTPAEFSLSPAKLVAVIPDIEAGLPSDLLERRPDIAAAEMQVASANAAIGVAKSAFFPVFSFSASGSFVHNSFSEWFTVPNRIWSVGPALALNLFQGGAMSARTDAAIAAWERTVADYRQTVLHAVSEVEDNLAATRYLQREEMLQTQAYEASRRAEEILQNQYSVGIVGFLDVVLAQEATLDNARALSQTRGARFATAVALIRALGGGWDTSGLHLTGEIEPVKTGEHE
ncbi:MAG: efflux transporter outer membrane subunit [Azoarcus sp.]|jgi:NodT family efflux transporter outer membrane factor (OMF) lipoprotein|nr:efflux transporter outer membrane subunit [Azoarcus sp.]